MGSKRKHKSSLDAREAIKGSVLNGHLQRMGDDIKRYSKRYFILKGETLIYYMRKNDDRPLGMIPLLGAAIEENTQKTKQNNHEFELHCADGKIHSFRATSLEEMQRWINAFIKASGCEEEEPEECVEQKQEEEDLVFQPDEDLNFQPGEQVEVMYEDGNYYPAVINHKTETGYSITFTEYSDTQEVIISHIRKLFTEQDQQEKEEKERKEK